jgi:hypothetical protein
MQKCQLLSYCTLAIVTAVKSFIAFGLALDVQWIIELMKGQL